MEARCFDIGDWIQKLLVELILLVHQGLLPVLVLPGSPNKYFKIKSKLKKFKIKIYPWINIMKYFNLLCITVHIDVSRIGEVQPGPKLESKWTQILGSESFLLVKRKVSRTGHVSRLSGEFADRP